MRVAALIVAAAGATGAVGLMLHAGRHNSSRLLLVLFALWVSSPFMALLLANVISKRRPVLDSVTLVLTLCSLAIYGNVALGPPSTKTAFAFVVVPPASGLLIGIAVLMGARISGRKGSCRHPTRSRDGANGQSVC